MDIVGIIWTVLGTTLVLFVLVEVFLGVLHIDNGGMIAPRLHRWIWTAVMALANRAGKRRRAPLALAGPIMIVATFATWIGLFVTGFALLYLPHIPEGFRLEPGVPAAGFIDSLYFSVGVGTVLGFGEITPLTPGLRILSFLQAGIGFTLFTSVVAYLLSVVGGVSERNALSMRLHTETGGTGDGVNLPLRSLREEDPTDLQRRLHSLTLSLQSVHEKMYQFPILDIYYRSRNPARDPERMLKMSGDAALTTTIIATLPNHVRLHPAAEELQRAVDDLIEMLAAEYFSADVERSILAAEVTPADRERVAEIRRRIETSDVGKAEDEGDVEERSAARLRLILDAMDRLTGWRRDLPAESSGARES